MIKQKIKFNSLASLHYLSNKDWSQEFIQCFFYNVLKTDPDTSRLNLHYLKQNTEIQNLIIEKLNPYLMTFEFDHFLLFSFSGESDSFLQEFLWSLKFKWLIPQNESHDFSTSLDLFYFNHKEMAIEDLLHLDSLELFFNALPESTQNCIKLKWQESIKRVISILVHKNLSDFYSSHFLLNQKHLTPLFELHQNLNQNKELIAIHSLELQTMNCISYLNFYLESEKNNGVDLATHFKVIKMTKRLHRLLNILSLSQKFDLSFVLMFLKERQKNLSLKKQFINLTGQLLTSISQTTAETGEHYVCLTKDEIKKTFYKACGGGFITGFTVLVKTLTSYLTLAPMMIGLLYSLNYTLSFTLIALLGFVLATKQPAAFAAFLAQQIDSPEKAFKNLTFQQILKSQIWAVLGNIGFVIPTVLVISFFCQTLFQQSFMTEAKALKEIKNLSLFSLTPLYALITGVILWFSSLIVGLADNFYKVNKLNKRLNLGFLITEKRKLKVQNFISQNFGMLIGQIFLGLALGMLPLIGDFTGLPLDVRHVTLSTGVLTSALYTLYETDISYWDLILAILGVLTTGFLNIIFSFYLSFKTVTQSKRIEMNI